MAREESDAGVGFLIPDKESIVAGNAPPPCAKPIRRAGSLSSTPPKMSEQIASETSAGITIGEKTGWFGAAKLRYLGPRPLIEDDSVRSGAMLVVNADVGYRFENGLRLQLDILNLFNSSDHQIDYFYVSRLQGEPLAGISDVHFHPIEPLAVRLTVAGKL